ncbi:D-inositol 3-phosphate glycosyltransferase [compost metagenome]
MEGSEELSIKNLRIARVSTVPLFVITQLNAQLSALKEAGAAVYVVASDDELGDRLRAVDGLKFLPVNIARDINLLQDLSSLVQLIRLFRKERFDVVHSTTPKAGLLCALAGWIARIDVRLHTFTGQPWVTMTGHKKKILQFCDRIIGWLNTHNYTDSLSQREFLIASGIVSSKKLSVIGSGSLAGVDTQRFNSDRYCAQSREALRRSLDIPLDAKVLLFVGRITPDKGISELVKAFERVAGEMEDVYLVVVGPFEANGKAVFDAVSDDRITSRFRFVGFTGEPEQYMSISDILCLPSYREGFGTVVIEAAAMGLPTVGTSIYGLTDAIVDGETGVLVPVRDAEKLADALCKLLADPELRQRMSVRGKARAISEFDSKHCSALLVKEYEAFVR